ncbi:MAG: aromatic amino acid transport family protein [Burkholderiales bacterium]|nr:aromatic amino acid transport family protein [Burkholderiales bacterium]
MKNLVLSSFIVAGAAIGSGVLALPLVADAPGVLNSLIFITITFGLAMTIALISVKVYSTYKTPDINAATIAKEYFGTTGYTITTILNLLSMGSLAAAYVNVGGDLISHTILPVFGINVSPSFGMMLFFLIFMPAFVIGINAISRLNGLIFATKFICLISAIIIGSKFINLNELNFMPENIKYIGTGASTFFCIWMMHMTIPLVLKINNWDIKKTKQALFIGLLIPAVAYTSWLLLIFSLVPRSELLGIQTVAALIHTALNNPTIPHIVGRLIEIFASITVLTAFFSIGFSLVAFVMDAFRLKDGYKGRFIATILSFCIPVAIAASLPQAFVMIYKQSNMFQIGASLIPVAAAFKLKSSNRVLISFILIAALAIILMQILDNLSILPVLK